MKWVKRIFWFGIFAGLCLALVIALLFVPAVQRQIALSVLSAEAEEVRLESISVGFGGVSLGGLFVRMPNGAQVELSEATIQGSMLSLGSEAIVLDTIEVTGLRIDVSQVQPVEAASDAVEAVESAQPAQEARELLDEFKGILNPDGGLPVTLSLNKLSVEGQILAPEQVQATFQLSGEAITPDAPGTLTWQTTVGKKGLEGAPDDEVNLMGTLTLRQRGQTEDPAIEAVLTATPRLASVEDGLPVVEVYLSARGTEQGEQYGFVFRLPLLEGGYANVFQAKANYASDAQALRGEFAFSADEALRQQIARFAEVPEFSGAANGRFETSFGEQFLVSVTGAADGRIERMEAMTDEVADALESVDLKADFNLKVEDTRLKISALDSSVISGDGETLFLISLPKPIDLDLADLEAETSDLEGELLVVELNDIPAATLGAFLPGLPITDESTGDFSRDPETGEIETLALDFSRGALSGKVILESLGQGSFRLGTTEPIRAREFVVSLPDDNFELTQPIDLELSFASTYEGNTATADIGPLTLSVDGEVFHRQQSRVLVSGIEQDELVIEGNGSKWTRLEPLMRQNLFAQDPFIGPWQAIAPRNPSIETAWAFSLVPDNTLRLDNLTVALRPENGEPLVELVAPGGLAVNLSDDVYDLSDVGSAYGTLFTLSIRDFPLAAVNQPAIGLRTNGNLANVTLTLAKRDENLIIEARQPLEIRDVNLSFADVAYVSNFSAGGTFSVSSDLGDKLALEFDNLSLREGRIPFAKGSGSAVIDQAEAIPLRSFKADLVIEDFPSMFNQPPLRAFDNLRRGSGQIVADVDLARAGESKLEVVFKNLMASDGFDSVTEASLKARGMVRPGEGFTAQVPFRIRTTAQSTSEGSLSLEGKFGDTQERLLGSLEAARLSYDDLLLLLKPFQGDGFDEGPPPEVLAEQQPPRRSLDEAIAGPAASSAEQATPSPSEAEWAGWVSGLGFDAQKVQVDLSLSIAQLQLQQLVFERLKGRHTQTAREMRTYFSATNAQEQDAVIEFQADFDPNAAASTSFDLKSNVAEFEPPIVVQVMTFDPRRSQSMKTPLLDGLINVQTDIQGRGDDLGDAFDNFTGGFTFASSGGVLNGLAGSNDEVARLIQLLNNPLATLALAQLGDKVKEIRGVLQVINYLNTLPYDEVRIDVARDEDFSTTIREFTLANPQVRVELDRLGTIGNVEGQSLLDQPLDIPLQFWARGDIAGTLDNLGLMGPPNEDNFYPLVRPFQLGGSLSRVESNLIEILLQPGFNALGGLLR
ncbi:MAG: hypothetical protein ACFBZ8_02675 [Opitutales bacterium]